MEKIFARCILDRLTEWVLENKVLPIEQAGFRKNHSTLDNITMFKLIEEKYTLSRKSNVYMAFIDFSTAFDKVDQPPLWKKLQNMRLPAPLLSLIIALHSQTWCQVLMGGNQGLTSVIPIENGLKQGCLLAPLLFSLYLADLPDCLSQQDGDAPKTGSRPFACLLYADDIVVMDLTPIGLNKKLVSLQNYTAAHFLKINVSKSKILIMKSRKFSKFNWHIGLEKLEVVDS